MIYSEMFSVAILILMTITYISLMYFGVRVRDVLREKGVRTYRLANPLSIQNYGIGKKFLRAVSKGNNDQYCKKLNMVLSGYRYSFFLFLMVAVLICVQIFAGA